MTLIRPFLAAVTLALPLAAVAPAPLVAQSGVGGVYHDAFRSRDAIADTLDAVSAFGEARGAGDRQAAEQAAADMLTALLRARFWLAMLDAEVTATSHSAEIGSQVTELRTVAVQGFDTVFVALADNDLAALERALDGSGDWLNTLTVNGRQVMTALFGS
ncbi:MAG TPA: hypothetical protein VJ994_04705 [Paracoccaceae bacterium]|nr:hypothetical protein [Paracoccaceae bacterium]